MMMRRPHVTPLFLFGLITGCGESSVVAPTAVVGSVRVTGQVMELGGRRVPDATVSRRTVAGSALATTTTDAAGRFEFLIDGNEPLGTNITLHVEKAGFEPRWVHADASGQREFEVPVVLYSIVRVMAGETVALRVSPGDPICGYVVDEQGYPCKRFRVRRAGAGLVVIWVGGPPTASVEWTLGVDGQFGPRLSVPVSEGAEVPVDVVLLGWSGSREVQVHTSPD
jgi:hypothetical protein